MRYEDLKTLDKLRAKGAAFKANNLEYWKYPLTIQFLK